jgi:hypothetical protein
MKRLKTVVRGGALALICVAAATSVAAAGQNQGGVGYLSWSATDSVSGLSMPPADTATLYVRVALVHEVKGFEFRMRWASRLSPACYRYTLLRYTQNDPLCRWVMRSTNDTPPIIDLPDTIPDSHGVAVSSDLASPCAAGVLAGFHFRFDDCTAADSGYFCLDYLKVIDGANVQDTLTVIGDAVIGTGGVTRPCGPLPPPRVDRIEPTSAYYGEHPTITISGFNFRPVPSVWLERTETAPVLPSSLLYVNGSQIVASFDLTNVAFGNWSLVVSNPDSSRPALPTIFNIAVPNAVLESVTPQVLFSGPAPGRATRMTIRGANFYLNPDPPAVRLENAKNRVTFVGTQTVVTGENEITTTFTIPDSVPGLTSSSLSDHAYVLSVQNTNSAQVHFGANEYLYHVSPQLRSVNAASEGDTNFVTWELDAETSGSRFIVSRDSYRCGIKQPGETRVVLDSVFTRGKRFHFEDAEPLVGRAMVYSVRQVYLLGGVDSIASSLSGTDTVGVRCPPGPFGVAFLGSPVRVPDQHLRVLFHLTQRSLVRVRVFDSFGRLARVLADEEMEAGDRQVEWDGTRGIGARTVPAGVYTIVAEAEGRSERRKVVILR